MKQPKRPWDVKLNRNGENRHIMAMFVASAHVKPAAKARKYLDMLGNYRLMSVQQHADILGVSRGIFYYALRDLGWENPVAGVWLSPRLAAEVRLNTTTDDVTR